MSQITGNRRIRMFRRGLAIAIIVAIVATVVLAYSLTRQKLPEVRTAVIGTSDISSTISMTAVIEPGATQTVQLNTQQRVEAVFVEVGDFVRAGDILVTFDMAGLEETYDTARDARIQANDAVKKLEQMARSQTSSGAGQLSSMQNKLSGMGSSLSSALSSLRALSSTQPIDLSVDQDAISQVMVALQAIDPNATDAGAQQQALTKQLLAAIQLQQNPAWVKQSNNLSKSLGNLGTSMQGLFNSLGSAMSLLGGSSAASQLSSLSTQAQAVTQQAMQAEALAKAALDDAIPDIRAEFDGVVAELNAEPGELIGPASTMGLTLAATSSPILVIYDNIHPQAKLRANRYDASRLAVGQPVVYHLDDLVFTGQVSRKSAIASSGSSLSAASSALGADSSLLSGMSSASGLTSEPMLEVTLSIDGSNPTDLILGFNIDAEIQVASARSVVALPAEAVRKELGQYYVYICNDQNVLERRDFTAGIQSDSMVEVVSGLESGLRVVLNPGNDLQDGGKVRVQQD